MTGSRIRNLICYLRRAAAPTDGVPLPDARLLDRFVATRDEAAFELLVRRHGPMVLSVCRRVLGDAHAAEDAFQASFLVLARKAASAALCRSVGGWLHTVALRVALRARARRGARTAREQPLDEPLATGLDPAAEVAWRDVRRVIDEEVSRLPEKYRVPFVLYHLQGRSITEVACELGCRVGTVESWLTRARQRLRVVLARRGIAPACGLFATLAAPEGWLPQVAAAVRVAQGAGAVSAEAAALAGEVVRALGMVKVKATVAVLGLLTAAVAVAGFTSGMLPCGQVPAPELTPRGELQPGKPPRAVELVPMGNLRGHIGGIHAVALAPNGKTLASAGVLDSQVRLWDVEARKEQATLQQGTGANVYCVAFSPDGKFLASGSNDKTIRLWEVATGKAQATLPNTVSIYAVAFSPDGKTLASAGGFQPLAEVSFQHFNEIPKELDFKEFGEVKLWDLTTGKARVFFRGDAGRINSVAFSANGKILASGGRDGAVRLWEVATGRELACFWEKGHSSSAVAFSPDGKTLAVAFIPEGKPSGLEKPAPKVALWDLPAQRERLQLRGLSGWVTALAFSPDGTLATSAQLPPSDPRQWQDASGEVQLWDVATGQPRSVPCPFRHRSSSLTFGAQGKLLATGGPRASGPGEITLWDLGLRAQKAAP